MSTKSKRSLLRGSKDYVAQKVEVTIGEDKYSFSLRELTASAQIAIEEWAVTCADDLGIDVEIVIDSDKLSEWLSKHSRDRHEASGLSVGMHFSDLLEDQWDIAVLDAMAGWDLGEELTPEKIKELPSTVKRPLFQALCAGSSLGVGAENFFL